MTAYEENDDDVLILAKNCYSHKNLTPILVNKTERDKSSCHSLPIDASSKQLYHGDC